jgi:hypothetical protein
MTFMNGLIGRWKNPYWVPDQATADRIRAAYLQAIDSHEQESSVLWSNVVPSRQRDIHEALIAGGKQLRDLFGRIETTNLYYGVDNICADAIAQFPQRHPEAEPPFDQYIFDKMKTLVEITGCGRTWNPEAVITAPEFQPSTTPEVNEVLSALDIGLSATLAFPNPFRGEIGLHTERGIISYRAVHAIYQAYRLRNLAKLVRGSRSLEIGAGMGRTAFYAGLLGISDYTIIDLPMTLVGQACFLSAAIGLQNVCLFGEPEKSGDAIRLYPPNWLFSHGNSFDVVMNVDSLTEMSRGYADRYIDFIKTNAKAFISINHEINPFTVRDLLPDTIRFPYVLRQGYVEEIFIPAIARP